MARKKSDPHGTPPTFEQALGELESIVAAMEEEQLPLEDLVVKYEQGTKLLGHCESILAGARKRLLTIAARDDSADPPDPSTDADPAQHPSDQADETDDDDDIRLF